MMKSKKLRRVDLFLTLFPVELTESSGHPCTNKYAQKVRRSSDQKKKVQAIQPERKPRSNLSLFTFPLLLRFFDFDFSSAPLRSTPHGFPLEPGPPSTQHPTFGSCFLLPPLHQHSYHAPRRAVISTSAATSSYRLSDIIHRSLFPPSIMFDQLSPAIIYTFPSATFDSSDPSRPF